MTQRYLHCVNLNNEQVCNNLAIPAALNSSMALNAFAFSQPLPNSVYSCDIDDLYTDPGKCFIGGIGSPIAHTLIFGAIFRAGLEAVNGLGQVMTFNQEQKDQMITKSDLEIDFERIRRSNYSTKPSRLSCIFLADDSFDGKVTIQNMFGDAVAAGWYRPHILTVKIYVQFSRHTGDIRWLDRYRQTGEDSNIHEYWQGSAFDSAPRFEHLVEGIILPGRESIEYIREHGTFWNGYKHKKYWQDLNLPVYEQWFN